MPLHMAATNGSTRLVELLYRCGADVNATDPVSTTPSFVCIVCVTPASTRVCNQPVVGFPCQFGSTPTHYAALSGNVDVIAKLEDMGADIRKPSLVRVCYRGDLTGVCAWCRCHPSLLFP